MVRVKKFVAGYLKTNTYLVFSDLDNTAIIIDAGGGLDAIDKFLIENRLNVVALLITHGHFDHITIAKQLKEKYNLSIYIHKEDEAMLQSEDNLASIAGIKVEKCSADVLLFGEEVLNFGEMSFKVIHTPGHSKGSVTYILNEKYMFAGDTIFFESFGATHFYGGSMTEMRNSLSKLFALDSDYTVFCGHDKDTSLEHERKHNPINYV
jgi:glyoxylase-like metal-dependent hydrolase (beta-lactamase superfamily II)